MPHINALLDNYLHLKPNPTGMSPHLTRSGGKPYRVVLFDIYGTLLLSASGDIDKIQLMPDDLAAATARFGLPFPQTPEFFPELIRRYRQSIMTKWEQQLEEGFPYPEIDILEIWRLLMEDMCATHRLPFVPLPAELRRMAMIFEICTNPVTPMPGMKELLDILRAARLPLGIVSNAQFYTPVILNYFLGGTWDEAPDLSPWFDPSLCVFSYREGRAKPDMKLFEKVKVALERMHIAAEEVLFVGNDVKKDMLPAAAAGFSTVLFAGDARSLRLYRDHPAAAAFRPDFVITRLKQLQEVCNL